MVLDVVLFRVEVNREDDTLGVAHVFEQFFKCRLRAFTINIRERIIDAVSAVDEGDVLKLFQQRWKGLLNLCNETGFRQIVLIDSPNVLGRDRWVTSEVSKTMPALASGSARRSAELELAMRIMRGAAAEAILAVAEANNTAATRRIVDGIINRLLTVVVDDFVDDRS